MEVGPDFDQRHQHGAGLAGYQRGVAAANVAQTTDYKAKRPSGRGGVRHQGGVRAAKVARDGRMGHRRAYVSKLVPT